MGAETLIAALFALGAGASFGLTSHWQRRALDHMDAMTGAVVSIATMAAVLWLAAPAMLDWSWWGTRAALLFAACGLLFPALSQQFQILSVMRVGPALTSAFGSFAPLFAIVPAMILLGETLNLQGAAGLGLLIFGLLIASVRPRALRGGWPLLALLLPLGASFARGIVQPVTKIGMFDVPSPFFATLVMTSVSTIVITLFWTTSGRARKAAWSRPGLFWFVLNGAASGAGIMLLQAAISLDDVTVAASLASTTPLWTLAFGALIFRNETLGLRHAAIACMVFVGVVLIVTR